MSKDIYVFAEQRDGKLQKVGIELVGKARELADDLGEKVVVMLIGSDVKRNAEKLIKHGADKVIVVEDPMLKEYVTEPYTKAVTKIINENDPNIVLYGASAIGRDLAPRVASRVHTGLTADCTKLDIDEETKLLLMTRPAFGGNIMATIVCENFSPQMATVRPGVMKALPTDNSRTGEIEELKIEFVEADMNVKIRQVIMSDKKAVDITEAKILVSGGRGVGSPEKFEMLKNLAESLNGEISSSRVAVESGWVDHDRQVGQTGKTVRPDLYMACGISGAIQHVAGMEGSEFILAINKDENAPIFGVADLGIVGDINTILPKLTDEINRIKAEQD
ncbi:electron transfer flavoprotein subunit alpha/FixB family protein [Anaerosacchariphilus polymeriproducens]|uniref:Electron transfer flavoprotein subunit alpha/FixB family protein n=1 Tax=Anaerosacchariphilus polymeriproducens TaxID=1812858 RepID=A0A371AU74_9FIRM|nr:electron transfer flavoprotein subunit alpha/FixB family protein [Anaerosacchariphilus polymeriproducens]RDU23092.1 electron transfer flavoprotein subunit alpha/FixB family protein [Anaerosacchariphilus polymeriproducens]